MLKVWVITMKMNLQLLVDSEKPDLGLIAEIESNRGLYERTGGRERIAEVMTEMLNGRPVTRQMIERWFSRTRRVMPSPVLLVAFLSACKLIKDEIRKTKKAA
jgi:hypothetical protein